jgi:hypothetical protein
LKIENMLKDLEKCFNWEINFKYTWKDLKIENMLKDLEKCFNWEINFKCTWKDLENRKYVEDLEKCFNWEINFKYTRVRGRMYDFGSGNLGKTEEVQSSLSSRRKYFDKIVYYKTVFPWFGVLYPVVKYLESCESTKKRKSWSRFNDWIEHAKSWRNS